MPTNIGRFEILSELSKSSTGVVYKANDPESGQTIALKTVQLSAFGESAAALEAALLEEFEKVKVLSSPNLTTISSAEVIDGQFCTAMEYVQGNSIATMLARKEGFSIWDLLDIGRQLSAGLDHAASQQIVHYSLEPSKIMCGWDGTVKILSFGVSSVGNFVQHAAGEPSSILHYMSPEQLRGEAMDSRSNLFSLGAMLYEMVTERKAFDREDAESLRESILESTPVAPSHVNAKVHPLLSDLIMKALAKDPAQRYQNGRELLNDLEKCKESKPVAKKAEAPKGAVISDKAKTAAVQAKFVGASAPSATTPVSSPAPAAKAVEPRPPVVASAPKLNTPKVSAAAAGVGANTTSSHAAPPDLPHGSDDAVGPAASMSSAVADEPPVETFEPQTAAGAPNFAVDPLMSEGPSTGGGGGTSFSEISELPPLKEVYVAPPPPPPVEIPPAPSVAAVPASFRSRQKVAEKPRIQPREVADKAIKEIKGVPPKLMLYSIAGAIAVILLIGLGVLLYIHSLNSDADPGVRRPTAATAPAPAQPVQQQAAPQLDAAAAAPADTTTQVQDQPTEITEPEAATPHRSAHARGRAGNKKKAVAAAVIPGQLTIDSTPQGAQIQLDGKTDPSWVTPVVLMNIQPGSHSITLSKSGFASDTRSVDVASGAPASTIIHLSQLSATLVVKSDPPGASIYIDGHNAGAKTPAQITVGKGQHLVLVRLSGYLDETMNAQFVLGQTFNFSPTLRALGNADSIHTVGKMSKLFGKGGQAGQATLVIHTQPKGAEIAVNQHMLEKNSPVDVMLDPGNYVIDITLTGYAPVHKVITAEKGNKMVIDEVLQPQ
ncbi:MAG: PEGA domain-containing protein [Candidatus Sulfotelmatobacter sp.]